MSLLSDYADMKCKELRQKLVDVQLELSDAKIALISADLVMEAIDIQVGRNLLDSRSMIADARLNYGTPFKYKYAPKDMLRGDMW